MNILILGNGGREHAMARQAAQSSRINQIFIAPGNGGTKKEFCNCDFPVIPPYTELLKFIEKEKIEYTLVGPEQYLADGVTDILETAGHKVFGPNRKAAMLESSKDYAKRIMQKAGVPTAGYEVFSDKLHALKYLETHKPPYVLKADGLAAGKGVIIAANIHDAVSALDEYFEKKTFGTACEKIIIEDFLKGQEATLLAFTDGKTARLLPPSQDHKRIFDDDRGPNTGGMGVYTPVPVLTQALAETARTQIIEPILNTLRSEGIIYKGILYTGLMIDGSDIRVVEFNVRFGDPECECVLPLLKTDFIDIIAACIDGTLEKTKFELSSSAACTVIMSSGGYPGKYTTGKKITGLKDISGVSVCHAGTEFKNGDFFTAGGRVLALTAQDSTLHGAIKKCYQEIAKVKFDGCYYRKDIGKRE